MRKAMLAALLSGLWAVQPMLAQQPKDTPKTVATQKEPNVVVEFFRSLDWYIWVLLILLFALIGVFFWVRNRSTED
jgi:hypothetical protein